MKRIFAALSLSCLSLALLSAQNSEGALATAYFTDGYPYRHNLNPAFVPTRSYVSVPFLNIGVGTKSKLSLDKVLYPVDGKLVTILSPDVPSSTITDNLAVMNPFKEALDLQLVSLGIFNKTGNIFTNVSLTLNQNAGVIIPRSVLEFARNTNPDNPTYNLGGIRADIDVNMNLNIGQSFKIGPVRAGYKVKFILGMAAVQTNMEKFDVTLASDLWQVNAKGNIGLAGVQVPLAKDGNYYDLGNISLDPSEFVGGMFKNFGFGVDLGASWDILSWIQVSAAIQDLGVINYKNGTYATTEASPSYNPSSAEGGNQLEDFGENLGDILKFKPGNDKSMKKSLAPVCRLGAQVRLPMHEKLSAGLLLSSCMSKYYPWTEVRGSINYDALKWLGLSVSCAGGTYGSQVGAMVNLHTKGFNIYAGVDNIPLSYTPQGLPIKTLTTCATMGINICFGAYHGRYETENE